METYKGFSLFNDLENAHDRAINRGRILSNIATDHQRHGQFSYKALALTAGYIRAVPVQERRAALDEFVTAMRKEGFAIAGTKDQLNQAIGEAIGR